MPTGFNQFSGYAEIQKIFQYFAKNDQNKMFIPLIYEDAKKYDDIRGINTSIDLNILQSQIAAIIKDISWKSPGIIPKQMDDDKEELRRIVSASTEEKTKSAYEKVKIYLEQYDDNEFITFIENMQILSVLEFSHHERINRLLFNALRLKDFETENKWVSLREKYINDLHSRDGIVATIILHKNRGGIFSTEYWEQNNIPNEFALFGFIHSEEINWKAALMTDLDYPFKVARIRILDDKEFDDKRKAEFDKLVEVMNGFIKESIGENKRDIRNEAIK